MTKTDRTKGDLDEFPSVVHVLPEDGLAGAEHAAKRAIEANKNLHVLFLRAGNVTSADRNNQIHIGPGGSVWLLSSLLWYFQMLKAREPEIAVFSLWKCMPAMILTRLCFPKIKTVVVLHSDRYVHLPDRLAHGIMFWICHAVWADSSASIARADGVNKPKRVLSFVLSKQDRIEAPDVLPSFIFWGRFHSHKNIQGAVQLFGEICEAHPDATLTLIGPDAGTRMQVEEEISRLGLLDKVSLLGASTQEEIALAAAKSSYFIQLSTQEGMGLSVVEAMQFGLVPIVTEVGEVANYCRHLENSIIHKDTKTTVSAITQLLNDKRKHQAVSLEASQTWQDKELYGNDFLLACKELLAACDSNNKLST